MKNPQDDTKSYLLNKKRVKNMKKKSINCRKHGAVTLEKNKTLEHELNDNHKKIRMLNKGFENLDQILAMGIPP